MADKKFTALEAAVAVDNTDEFLVIQGTNVRRAVRPLVVGTLFEKTADTSDDIAEGTTQLFLTPGEADKLGYISVTQPVDLDTVETNANNVPGIKTKTDFITVSQPVDLDAMETDIAAKLDDTQFSGLSKITVGTSAPATPSVGDLWVDTN